MADDGRTSLVVAPPAVFRSTPPYARLEALPWFAWPDPVQLEPGTVWLVSAAVGGRDRGAPVRWVQRLRATYPSVAVGMLLPAEADPDATNRPDEPGPPAPGAVLREGEPIPATLRQRMTHPLGLGADVTEWLSLRGVPLRPRVRTIIRALFNEDHPSLAEALDHAGASQRTTRRLFAGSSLPAPSAWHAVARALHSTLRLQGEPDTPVLRIAYDAGDGDHSSLSRQFVRLFGVRPSDVRPTLGWEWVLERWVGSWATGVHAGDMRIRASPNHMRL